MTDRTHLKHYTAATAANEVPLRLTAAKSRHIARDDGLALRRSAGSREAEIGGRNVAGPIAYELPPHTWLSIKRSDEDAAAEEQHSQECYSDELRRCWLCMDMRAPAHQCGLRRSPRSGYGCESRCCISPICLVCTARIASAIDLIFGSVIRGRYSLIMESAS